MTRPVTRRSERGYATVAMLAAVAVVLIAAAAGLTLGSAVIASHRARAAVDLAALAGADALMRGLTAPVACASASVVASANGARVLACSATGPETLEVTVAVRPTVAHLGDAIGRARAGPAPGSAPEPAPGGGGRVRQR